MDPRGIESRTDGSRDVFTTTCPTRAIHHYCRWIDRAGAWPGESAAAKSPIRAVLSLATAAEVGNVRTWITNEHEHDGLRVGNALPHLLGMLDEGL